jgi:hypothetical protein
MEFPEVPLGYGILIALIFIVGPALHQIFQVQDRTLDGIVLISMVYIISELHKIRRKIQG